MEVFKWGGEGGHRTCKGETRLQDHHENRTAITVYVALCFFRWGSVLGLRWYDCRGRDGLFGALGIVLLCRCGFA